MDKRTLSLSGILALSAIGNLYTLVDGQQVAVEAAVDIPRKVEITAPALRTAIANAITKAQAKGVVTCERLGVDSNRAGEVYCRDTGTAGWIVPEAAVNAFPAVKSALEQGSINLLLADDGRLYAGTSPGEAVP